MGKKKKQRKPRPKAPKQNMRKMLAQAQELQKTLELADAAMAVKEFSLSHEGIDITMLGTGRLIGLKIAPKLLSDDLTKLEQLLADAINLGRKKADEMSHEAQAAQVPDSLNSLFNM